MTRHGGFCPRPLGFNCGTGERQFVDTQAGGIVWRSKNRFASQGSFKDKFHYAIRVADLVCDLVADL